MPSTFSSLRCLLLPGLATALCLSACTKEPPPVEDVRPVHVVEVKLDGGGTQTTYTGDVRARYETALSFRVAGKIVERKVEVGSHVARGDLLARLDPSDYQLNIEAANSQLVAARSDFAQAQDELKRFRELYEKKFISAAEFDRRQTAFDVAKARLEQAQAQLGVTRNQSAYTSLRADHAGIVTAIAVEVGQVVTAGQTVMRVARPDEKEVVVAVPESKLDELRAANAGADHAVGRAGNEIQGPHSRDLAERGPGDTHLFGQGHDPRSLAQGAAGHDRERVPRVGRSRAGDPSAAHCPVPAGRQGGGVGRRSQDRRGHAHAGAGRPLHPGRRGDRRGAQARRPGRARRRA